ncbi:MAG: fibronectin type III domain-containing protein, partial [Chloroflexota bacterium]
PDFYQLRYLEPNMTGFFLWTSALDLAYNRISVSGATLLNYLREMDNDWASTQTNPPTDVTALVLSENSVQLSWTPIDFQDKEGYYEIALASDSFLVPHSTTNNKASNTSTLTGLAPNTTYHIALRTYTAPHDGPDVDDPENEQEETPADDQPHPQWSEYSEIITISTPGIHDFYEMDDTCTQASTIALDGLPQYHTFHHAEDEDWVKVEAQDAGTYRVEVIVPYNSSADVSLYQFDRCDSQAEVAAQFVETTAINARLDVVVENISQPFYLKLMQATSESQADESLADESLADDDMQYELSVRPLASVSTTANGQTGLAVVVAGRQQQDDPLQELIHQNALNAYNFLLNTGYSAEKIFFLATDSTLPGFDGDATTENLALVMTQWATERLAADDTANVLTLYLVGHSKDSQFYLDNITEQIVTIRQLDGWLTRLSDELPDLQVNIMIESSQSGRFMADSRGSLSKEGRIILTSTSNTQTALLSPHGANFFNQLFTFIQTGYTLADSFRHIYALTEQLYPEQVPWLDSNGNGIPNEFYDLWGTPLPGFGHMEIVGVNTPPLSTTQADGPPLLRNARLSQSETNQPTQLLIDVYHNAGIASIKTVWAEVYPLEILADNVLDIADGQLVMKPVDIIQFVAPSDVESVTFSVDYPDSSPIDAYQFIIHAHDSTDRYARPIRLHVDNRQHIFLPIISY